MRPNSFLIGVMAGAGAMYLLDPVRGTERRSRLGRRLAQVRAGLENGALPDPRSLLGWEREVPRSRADDAADVDVLALRSGGRDLGRLKATSTLVGVAGGALAAYGLARRGRVGGAMRAIGATMLASGLRDLEGAPRGLLRERRRALEARRSIHIAAPPDAVFRFWSDVANMPRFMAGVTTVRDLGGGRSEWVGDTAAGVPVSWTARVTERMPGKLLAWRSEPNGAGEQSAAFRFTPAGTGTRVDARVAYVPAIGQSDKAAAGLFGDNPSGRLGAELERARKLIETEGGR
jgi:uncharacterized membrane protein